MTPLRFALPSIDVAKVRAERRARATGAAQPWNIRLVLDAWSDGGVLPLNAGLPPRDAVGFAYHLSPELMRWAALGGRYIFLVWGLRRHGPLRDCVAKLLLTHARHVLVNDHTSACEVRTLVGREPTLAPFVVDSAFFSFHGAANRDDFLFCPSTVDRDPGILCALATQGRRVIWLNNDPRQSERYADVSPNLRLVSGVSFEALRALYQSCRACILPLARDAHAAGQTTALEAIACGAPVFITRGRTSGIFASHGLVSAVEGDTIRAWEAALEDTASPPELQRRRERVAHRHDPATVGRLLAELACRT